MARMRDLKDALVGKTRRIEELEDVLRFALLAAEVAREESDAWTSLEIIVEKAKRALDND